MALRTILTSKEPRLYKKCRHVTAFDERLHVLLDDMRETLTTSEGIGLAAPQIGVLRCAVLVLETNVPEDEEPYVIELINPEVIKYNGNQNGPEGCLSVPGRYGLVSRPMNVTIKAQDRDGEWFEISGKGLTARAFCHEIDHLQGVVFTSVAERMLSEEELETGSWQEDLIE